jgi:pyrimidine deaminase RibD-like protein
MSDRRYMELAIAMAEHCAPKDPDRIPKVGAVIVVGDAVVATGFRGDDDHAEKIALSKVPDRAMLPNATVFTTLEPCTHQVRTQTLESCTDLLVAAQVKKVVIGILDPNQGVCGKGVVRLQQNKIEVELFSHDLAQRVLGQNEQFVRAQQSLGLLITSPENGAEIQANRCQLRGTFINPPGSNVVAITNIGDQWWPQPGSVRPLPERENEWEVTVYFGITSHHKIYLVKGNELGMALIDIRHRVTPRFRCQHFPRG